MIPSRTKFRVFPLLYRLSRHHHDFCLFFTIVHTIINNLKIIMLVITI